ALKILPPDLAASNPQHAQRFLREAEAQASLDHPNVVAIHQVRKHESYHLIEMQFLAGGSVADLLRAGPLKAEVAARIAREAAQGLAAAHKKKLVHRDVKPQNILLGEDGTAKVSDFGLAKAVDATGGLTASGLVLGTPHYMSPEQASNARLDGRSDIYSLGTTLYHMLTGTLPFEAESTVGVMYHHCCTRPRSPRDIRPGISQSLANVCLNAMLKVSANRYQTMDEFIADLDRAMSGQSVKMRAIEDVRAPGRVETRRLAPSEPVSQAPPSLAALSKPMRRRAAWAVTLALCVLLGCLMGVRLGNRWLAGKRAETARASPKPVKTEAESAAPTPKPEAPEPASQAPPAPVAPAANPPTPPTTAAIETRREAETTSPKAPVANAAPTPAVSEAAQRDGVPATMDVDLGGAFVMLLVYIPAGEFTMGSPEHEKGREPNEGPLHRVRITKPFYMGVYEVTRGQFVRFVQETGHQTDGERSGSGWNQKGATWESRAGVHWRNPLFEQ
ncbi:MAG: hypothetical protein FJ279_38800, partial [Planctomycetes bacterium]|nr:hypothetical protein [Planctomycetota bacterium]